MSVLSDYMTMHEVARFLKIHYVSVSRLVAKGELSPELLGRNYLFRREDVIAYRLRTKRRGRSPH